MFLKWLLSLVSHDTLLSLVKDMDATAGTGVQIAAYFRSYLNMIGHDWEECMRLGEKFNLRIENADWLTTDKGIMFEKTFVPDKAEKQKVYGRCFIPHYALLTSIPPAMELDYAPWMLMHTDRKMLSDSVLLEKWKHFYCKEDDDVLDAFYDLLKSEGYRTSYMEHPVLVLEVT